MDTIAIAPSELLLAVNGVQLEEWLRKYEELGPVPGIVLPFLKSFVPPLPTLVIITLNAAAYGLWLGFLYSWIGLVLGCLAAFLLIRKVTDHPKLVRWMSKPKVARGMRWIQRNAFSYVFLLSLFPVGPFIVINIAAGLARIRVTTFVLALASGKAVMVFVVSCFGYDLSMYGEHPTRLLYIVGLVVLSWIAARKLEARYSA